MDESSVGRAGGVWPGWAGRKNIWVWSATALVAAGGAAAKSGHRAFATDLLVGFSWITEEQDSENIRFLIETEECINHRI